MFIYGYRVGVVDLDALRSEIEAAGLTPEKLSRENDLVHVAFAVALSVEQAVVLSGVMESQVDDLEAYRARTIVLIDEETTRRCLSGFEFPADSGRIFSTSDRAQRNWSDLHAFRDAVTYPKTICLQDGTPFQLVDADEVYAFQLRQLTVRDDRLTQGIMVRVAIGQATTKAEVDAAAKAWLDGK